MVSSAHQKCSPLLTRNALQYQCSPEMLSSAHRKCFLVLTGNAHLKWSPVLTGNKFFLISLHCLPSSPSPPLYFAPPHFLFPSLLSLLSPPLLSSPLALSAQKLLGHRSGHSPRKCRRDLRLLGLFCELFPAAPGESSPESGQTRLHTGSASVGPTRRRSELAPPPPRVSSLSPPTPGAWQRPPPLAICSSCLALGQPG